jgi:hypothetical protein
MKRRFHIVPVLGVLMGVGVGSAYAQTSESLRASVPFAFKVGGATLPAGTYQVSCDGVEAPGVLVVRSKDGHHEAIVLTENVDTRDPQRDARLVFEREGQVYALSEVFGAGAHNGLEVLGTHATD